jgi:hypothetical protein
MNHFIVSLGPFCITKTTINQMDLISKTMPFDWMFSSLPFIKNVLIDNFSELLNKENIRSTNPCWSKDKSYNILYNNTILQSKNITTHLLAKKEFDDYNNFHMWNHYNLLEEEQYVKYVKYVERFRQMINSTDLKIFLYIHYYDDTLFDVFDFNEYLMNQITNYKFICIHCKKVEVKNNYSERGICCYKENNLHIYNIEIEKFHDTLDDESIDFIKKIINDLTQ